MVLKMILIQLKHTSNNKLTLLKYYKSFKFLELKAQKYSRQIEINESRGNILFITKLVDKGKR